MKHQVKFIARQAAQLDRSAIGIFHITRMFVNLTLLVSLGLLIAAPLSDDRMLVAGIAEGLFHAVFRMAAVGAVTGFAADIAAKRSRR